MSGKLFLLQFTKAVKTGCSLKIKFANLRTCLICVSETQSKHKLFLWSSHVLKVNLEHMLVVGHDER